jgi:hypothetical protein
MRLTTNRTQFPPINTGTCKSGEWKKKTSLLNRWSISPKVYTSIWSDKINEDQL